MKILITGANGFIGAHLCQELSSRKIDFRATARNANENNYADFVGCDLETTESLNQLMDGCDIVVHLAGRAHVTSDDSQEKYRIANEFVTHQLANAAAQNGIARFVYISSIKVNGESSSTGRPIRSFDTPNPLDNYGRSKLAAEQVLQEICRVNKMEYVIIRPTLVYGKGVKANFSALISAVKRGIPLPIATVKNARSMIGINNLVDLIIATCTNPKAANQTFLASDGIDTSTPALVRFIAASLNRRSRIFPFPISVLRLLAAVFGKSSAIDKLTGSLSVDISHTKNTLDWRPPFSIESEIAKAVK
ncbi:MAG: UDP-glucose 4-epimerase (Galactowaldenase) (UDP-galactose 4-epimerase) CapN-like [Actinomycetota bacterium]